MVRNAESVGELRSLFESDNPIRRAVHMQAHINGRWVSCVQDVLVETSDGFVCVDFSIRAVEQLDEQAEQVAQALRGALLVQSGRKLARVGTIFLADGVWRELSAPQQQVTAFLERLRDLSENQPPT